MKKNNNHKMGKMSSKSDRRLRKESIFFGRLERSEMCVIWCERLFGFEDELFSEPMWHLLSLLQ